ncbi:hypothetical protein L2K70_04790 [Nocardioides KLBMP 9356]|uniref:Uncharacterized protein n=1 Tax=Nocardioides potassii TaxID=2911371 RepID=A0ABS9H6T1_9ACTN|nr:hypothetical protein [Nocardioides potassii]MCF6376912.1 hypothetical protein [Nocardioides potassii]
MSQSPERDEDWRLLQEALEERDREWWADEQDDEPDMPNAPAWWQRGA